ncbi:MAG: hypothetical protein KatS3mg077_0080 [Candidatus Binatia bacterium]|nr:MAG: hypothetical protein KatS3mg077_0080 [Candidatus Binatia bacterium]
MLGFGAVVYADLTLLKSSKTPPLPASPQTTSLGTPAIQEEVLLAEAARVTVRVSDLDFPVPLPTPTEEILGGPGLQWVHRTYEISLPRQMDIAPLTRPFLGLRDEFPALNVHTDDRPQALEIHLGIAGLRTHTFRFHWLDRPPRIAFLVAHLGTDMSLARQFLALGANLSFAVRPSEPFSDVIREQIRLAGAEAWIEVDWDFVPEETRRAPGAPPTRSGTRYQSEGDWTQTWRASLAEAQKQLADAAGILVFAEQHNLVGPEELRELREVLAPARRLLWAEAHPRGEGDPCSWFRAKGVACRPIETPDAGSETDATLLAARVFRALARAQTTGEALEMVPGNAEGLGILREALPRFREAGIEIVPASALAGLTLSQPDGF